MRTPAALLWGSVFGAGLALSGMTNPAKVLAFLDVAGSWDPTLAVVMASAVTVSAVSYAVARRRERPLIGDAFAIPTRRDVDAPLVVGAALFGVGWGLVGLCPGPALADLIRGSGSLYLFAAAMTLGAGLYRLWTKRSAAS